MIILIFGIELLTPLKAQEEVEKVKKKYRDNGWRIIN